MRASAPVQQRAKELCQSMIQVERILWGCLRGRWLAKIKLRFIDPTGHIMDQCGGASSLGDNWWKKRQEKLIVSRMYQNCLLADRRN
jgi:hypothetical protein